MAFTNRRVRIRDIRPVVDAGALPAKGSVSAPVEVSADVFADSHDLVAAVAAWRLEGENTWHETAMAPAEQDRWRGRFHVPEPGRYEFCITGWVDHFATWQRDTRIKLAAGTASDVDLLGGAQLIEDVAAGAPIAARGELEAVRDQLTDTALPPDERAAAALSDETTRLVATHEPRTHATVSDTLPLRIDRDRARCSSWYELFPRSASPDPERHGTFDDVIARLGYVAGLGFDVLYLPPIHPIGASYRKGADNRVEAAPGEPGSPWAIGSADGGHTAIHPELGDLDGLHRLIAACTDHGLELALDIAFQCSPDHPWVTEHPEWFKRRADGSVQYAENPPKKYQDIYPLDFETPDVEGLWRALKGVFEYWIAQGVRIFRVDNPHTKAFAFWEWCIDELTRDHPDVILLAEAFARPNVMYELARLGFHQSYTYFTWRTTQQDFAEYYTELFDTPVADFFRPNSWPNTPDILPPHLTAAGRPVFVQRLVLAATLTANYGIYGPAFELMLSEPREGAEEYAGNEKYQQRHWDLDAPDSLAEMITLLNAIRRDNPALQHDHGFAVQRIDNGQLFAFSKTSPDGTNVVLVVVNLDAEHTQAATTHLNMAALGLADEAVFEVHDVIAAERYVWQGPVNYVELDPHVCPAHVFVVSVIPPEPSTGGPR